MSPIDSPNGLGPSSPPSHSHGHRFLSLTAALLSVSLVETGSARAASQTWSGGSVTDGNWSDTANWDSGVAPGSTTDTTNLDEAVFNAAIANTWGSTAPIVIDSPTLNLGGITFDTANVGAYFIGSTGGNSLLLSSGGTIQMTATAITANQTINAPLVIEGTDGTYTFANNSTSTGTLTLGGAISGGAAGATVLTLAGTNTGDNTISGSLSNGSSTTLAITKSGAGTWVLTGANSYSGGTIIQSGILRGDVNGGTQSNVFGTGSVQVGDSATGENAQLDYAGFATYANNTIVASGSGTRTISTSSNNAGESPTLSGTVTLNNNVTLSTSSLGGLLLSGPITGGAGANTITNAGSGTGGVTLSGNITDGTGTVAVVQNSANSTLTLGGAGNTFSGGLTISSGTVSISSNLNLGGVSGTNGTVSINGGTLKVNLGSSAITNTHPITIGGSGGTIAIALPSSGTPTWLVGNNLLSGSGNLTISGVGTLGQSGSNGSVAVFAGGVSNNSFSGNITIQNGAIVEFASATGIPTSRSFNLNSLGMLSANGVNIAHAINLNDGGYLAFQNNNSGVFSGVITLSGSTNVRLQDWWAATVRNGTITGPIGGAGGLNINSGSGTGGILTLTGANTYTGTTTIGAATLQLGNGSSDGSFVSNVVGIGSTSTLAFANINPFTYAGALTGVIVTKTGAGTLSLAGTNSITTLNLNSNTTVNLTSGTLSISNNGGSTIQSTTGGTINGTGGTIVLNRANDTDGPDIGTANGTTLTINANITGNSSLESWYTSNGTGVTVLGGTNTYTGPTIINAGVISVSNIGNAGSTTSNLGTSGTINLSSNSGNQNSTLRYTGAGETTNRVITFWMAGTQNGGIVEQSGASGLLKFTSNLSVPGTGAKTLTLQGSTAGLGEFAGIIADGTSAVISVTKSGTGVWALSGNNTYNGATTVSNGTLNYTGALTSSGGITVGNTAAKPAILNLSSPGLIQALNLTVGTNATATGAVFQTSGTLSLTQGAGMANFVLGGVASGYGYYGLSGGTVTANEIGIGGGFAASTGVMDVSGGTFTDNGYITIGRGSTTSSGLLNVTGGAVSAARIELNWAGSSGATSVINIGGGAGSANVSTLNSTTLGLGLSNANVAGTQGIANLLANGTLTTGIVTVNNANSTSLLNFNGGTLKAATTNAGATFLTSANGSVFVYGNGGTIDNNGTSITISKGLLAPTGNGVNSISLSNAGTGYLSAPMVTISGGGGTGATAYAIISSGTISSIVITNPGTNYSTTPTVNFIGGGGSGAAVGSVVTSANTGGGLTFQGAGTTTLSGSSTFSGGATINAGEVKATFSSATPITLGNLGAGTITLNAGRLHFLPTGNTSTSYTVANNVVLAGGTLWAEDGNLLLGGTTNTINVTGATTLLRTWGHVSTKALQLNGILEGSAALTLSGTAGNAGEGASVWINNAANTYSGTVTVNANTGTGGFAMVTGANNALQYANVNLQGTRTAGATDAALLYGVQFASGVTAPVLGSLAGNGNINLVDLGSNAVTLNVGSNHASTSFSGILSGAGGLAKSGTGTMILSGNNTYSGATNVNTGTLTVNATNSGTGQVSVASGATLNGSGSVAGAVLVSGALAGTLAVNNDLTINAAGTMSGSHSISGNIILNNSAYSQVVSDLTLAANKTLSGSGGTSGALTATASNSTVAPGNSGVGTLTLGSFASATGAHLAMDINGTTAGLYDQVVTTSAVSLSGGDLALNIGSFTPGSETIYLVVNSLGGTAGTTGAFNSITFTGAGTASLVSGNGAEGTQLMINGAEYNLTYGANFEGSAITGGNDIALVAVPEPITWAMLLSGLGLLIIFQHFRSRMC